MAFTSFLIDKFDHTHENLFFNKFSNELKRRYSGIPGEHVLIGNISCNGHKMDAIFLKRGQLDVIDFKDYGGKLHFSENNPWRISKSDGSFSFVSGGSQIRNPYQQVRAYKFSLMKFLSGQSEYILSENRNDINWGHIGSIVLFQNNIDFNMDTLPDEIKRNFQVADVNTIYNLIESKTSHGLAFTDNEIQSILKVLDIRPENDIENINFITEDDTRKNNSDKGEKLALIKRLVANEKGSSEISRLISYYRTILNVERFKEPTASNLHIIPVNLDSKNYLSVEIDLSHNKEFYKIFIDNLNERFPKNLFIGLNISIDNRNYPLFHTIILASDIKDTTKIIVNIHELEIYIKSLEQLGLSEDLIEEITIIINSANTLEKKLEELQNQLSISLELSQSFQVGLSNESLFSVQLISELGKLRDFSDKTHQNELFSALLANKTIKEEVESSSLDSIVQITPLNKAQRRAIELSFKQPLTVITGPPGTGKSQVVMNIITNAITSGKSVLFASKNNRAVDNVKERIDDLLNKQYLLRFGSKDEIVTKAIPAISKSINQKNQGNYSTQLEELPQTLFNINQYNDRLRVINEELIQIGELEKKINENKIILNDMVRALNTWLHQLDNDYLSMFIEKALSVNVDINEVSYLYQKVTRIRGSSLRWFIFNIFTKNKTVEIVDKINRSQDIVLYDYIKHKKPWASHGENLLDTVHDNLLFIIQLKAKSDDVKKINSQKRAKISSMESQISALEIEYEALKSKEASHLKEIESIEKLLPQIGLQALQMQIEQYLYTMNTSKMQHYLDYLPANNIWKYEELTDFTFACKNMLDTFKAVCVTSLSIKNSFSLSPSIFDLLVIDEASQCDIASALPLFYRAKKVVVIGDPLQLKHITSVQPSEERYLIEGLKLENYQLNYVDNSLYDYCYSLSVKSNLESVFLDEHYRCHPEIINFSNINFYESKLGQSLKIMTQSESPIQPSGINWINVMGEMHNEKNVNIAEVNACVDLLNRLTAQYPTASIGVITPFRDQYKTIFDRLPNHVKTNVKVDTVHKFQGDEKDIIIFSTVVASNAPKAKANFINRNDYLLNVAITRARKALFIVGDYNYCSKNRNGNIKTPLSLLADYVQELNKHNINLHSF